LLVLAVAYAALNFVASHPAASAIASIPGRVESGSVCLAPLNFSHMPILFNAPSIVGFPSGTLK
jgi:hypothetical protein